MNDHGGGSSYVEMFFRLFVNVRDYIQMGMGVGGDPEGVWVVLLYKQHTDKRPAQLFYFLAYT